MGDLKLLVLNFKFNFWNDEHKLRKSKKQNPIELFLDATLSNRISTRESELGYVGN